LSLTPTLPTNQTHGRERFIAENKFLDDWFQHWFLDFYFQKTYRGFCLHFLFWTVFLLLLAIFCTKFQYGEEVSDFFLDFHESYPKCGIVFAIYVCTKNLSSFKLVLIIYLADVK
jgi:hypothetical protein